MLNENPATDATGAPQSDGAADEVAQLALTEKISQVFSVFTSSGIDWINIDWTKVDWKWLRSLGEGDPVKERKLCRFLNHLEKMGIREGYKKIKKKSSPKKNPGSPLFSPTKVIEKQRKTIFKIIQEKLHCPRK